MRDNKTLDENPLNAIGKILKIAVGESNWATQKSRYINPDFEQGDIVHCSELGKKYFAIVWLKESEQGTITVIPISNINTGATKDRFNIGAIEKFCNEGSTENFVWLNKISEITCSKVEVCYQVDEQGEIIETDNIPIKVKLNLSQIERIKEAMQIVLLGEGQTLLDWLKVMPEDWWINLKELTTNILEHGNRQFKAVEFFEINATETLLTYKLTCTGEQNYYLPFKQIKYDEFMENLSKVIYSEIVVTKNILITRNNIYKAFLSQQPKLVEEAETILKVFNV
ncbi:MAG: hypothetical protein ATN36_02900 [Epulopiscium sp. Nele67-Bin005]|nr:MAG: hypothetical protein ATN36_02900 [Epulopiscium sp. Nele67-Bin005]